MAVVSHCVDADESGVCDGEEFLWQYDAYGNLLTDGVSTYTYNAAMRLTTVTDGVSTSTFVYNGDGDRVSQTVDGTLTSYVLDVATPLTMVLAETTGEDSILYLHGLDLVAQSDGANVEYFAYDGLGSVRQVLDDAASVLLAQTYDPYGNIYESVGAGETRFGFTGEQVDASGLVYLRARYYSPGMGRFLNADPSRQEMNPYQYGLSNPIAFIDPSGRQSGDPCEDWATNGVAPANLQYDMCVQLWDAYEAGDTQFIYNWYDWLWSTFSVGPFGNASALGQHFLENTGTDYEMSDGFARTVRSLQIVEDSLEDHKNWYLDTTVRSIAEHLGGPGGSSAFGPNMYDDLEAVAIGGVNLYHPRIYLAWNAFWIGIEYSGNVRERRTWFGLGSQLFLIDLTASYRAHDEYDWHPGLSIPNPYGGRIPDDWAYLIDQDCLAESFESHFEWTVTQRIRIRNGEWPEYNTDIPHPDGTKTGINGKLWETGSQEWGKWKQAN